MSDESQPERTIKDADGATPAGTGRRSWGRTSRAAKDERDSRGRHARYTTRLDADAAGVRTDDARRGE